MFDFVEESLRSFNDIERWQTYEVTRAETLGEHTTVVCGLSWILASAHDTADPQQAVEKALWHDLEESVTGDIPRWVKREDTLSEAIEDTESVAIDRIVDDLPESVGEDLRDVWSSSKDESIEGQIVRASDLMAAVYYAYQERQRGNTVLIDQSDIERGIEDTKDACRGITPAEDLFNELLAQMEREPMVSSEAETDVDFDAEYLLLYFGADWCGPCEQQRPIIEQIDTERDDIEVEKIDVDERPELAEEYNVRGVPSVVLFDSTESMIARSSGVTQRDQIYAEI